MEWNRIRERVYAISRIAARRTFIRATRCPPSGLRHPLAALRGEGNQSRTATLRLRLIRSREFELAQVLGVDAGHVVAREARIVEVLEVFVAFGHGFDEVGQVLVDQPVG